MKVEFRYSAAYDHVLTLMSLQPYEPSQVFQVKNYISDLEVFWLREEKKIMKEIERVSGLKLPGIAECYIVKHLGYSAISHPFTVRMNANLQLLRSIVVHELIHILLAAHGTSHHLIEALNKRYPTQDAYFKSHIPVFLIQRKVLDNLYGSQAMKSFIRSEVSEEELPILQEANRLYRNFDHHILRFLQ